MIRHDPFYNPNLTREAEDYSLNFDAPTIADRLGLIGDGLPTVRYGSDRGPEAEVSPIPGPKGEVAQDQADVRPPAVSSKTLIEFVTGTIDLGRHIQGMEGRWRDRFNELSPRLEQQMSRPSPERDAPVANRDRPAADSSGDTTPRGGRGERSVQRSAHGRQRGARRPGSAGERGVARRGRPRACQRVPSQTEQLPAGPPTDP